jgi:hypothetical protein
MLCPRAMKLSMLLCTTIAATTYANIAAADPAPPLDQPPRGAGTQTDTGRANDAHRVYAGPEAGGALGTGFSSVYGVGVAGRLGYSFDSGIYLGGAFTQFVGDLPRSASFLGAEAGYKLFPSYHWELRPYAFLGPAIIDRGRGGDVGFAVQPSMLGAYHFGPWFLSADARIYALPEPTTLALFAGAGAGF